MYTVLLVDDEKSVLDVLQATIAWQELGVDTLLTASDGEAAMTRMEQQPVDLLVTDIRMPRMDGLVLIQKVRTAFPETRCILLTAYGEFEYAKAAIRLGVENYLLKPVAKQEFEQTVHNALDNLYQKRKNSTTLLQENTLRRWAGGSISGEELGERAALFNINLYEPAYCVVCVAKQGHGSLALFRANCMDQLSAVCDVYAFWSEKSRYTFILGGKALPKETVEGIFAQEIERLGLAGQVLAAIGSVVPKAEMVHLSAQIANELLDTAKPAEESSVLTLQEGQGNLSSDFLAEEIRMSYLEPKEAVREKYYDKLIHRLECALPTEEVPEQIAHSCIQLLAREFPLRQDSRGVLYDVEFRLAGQPPALQALQLLQEGYKLWMLYLASYSPIVQLTIRYIQRSVNNGEGVSIREFCATNSINPAYLGHLFKEETGIFFNDYLLQCRISASVLLLRNPNNRVRDIAEKIGFTSTSYFVKRFGEAKGMSPAKYRLQFQREEQQ